MSTPTPTQHPRPGPTSEPATGPRPTSMPSGASASAGGEAAEKGMIARRFPRLHARYTQVSSSRIGRFSAFAWRRKRPIFIGLGITYGVLSYSAARIQMYKRDKVQEDSWLVLRVHPGAIVECKTRPTLTQLLHAPSPGEDLPQVMELFEVCRAVKLAAGDERIRGIFADFTGLHIPSEVTPEPLGLAQIEELVEAIHEFKINKKNQRKALDLIKTLPGELQKAKISPALFNEAAGMLLESVRKGEDLREALKEQSGSFNNKEEAESDGKGKPISPAEVTSSRQIERETARADLLRALQASIEEVEKKIADPVTVAWSDTFDSQGDFLLASAFEKVYLQPSGEVPLIGARMTIPFFKRALDWLGIDVHAEARREYKSMVSSFVQEDGLPPAQIKDEARLMGELSRNMAHTIGVNRFPDLPPEEAADKVAELSRSGPFTALEAKELGLITDTMYRSELKSFFGEGNEEKLRSLGSYSRITNALLKKRLPKDQQQNIAVVYMLGSIAGGPGEFSASSVIKGLKEAGEDDDVSAIVLRIDSGGGSVLTSDSLWDTVNMVQKEYKKPIVASFGNMSASGGYYMSACADYIMACESTVTGSIGVASLRPNLTSKLFDKLKVNVQTLFTGSNRLSVLHGLTEQDKTRLSREIDDIYDVFLDKVCKGRQIDPNVIEQLAGGRVWTGLAAWMKCNPDKDLVRTELDGASKITELKEGNEIASQVPHVKITSLTPSDWKAVDVTRAGQMSTLQIEPEASLSTEQEGAREIVREVATNLFSDDETSLTNAMVEEIPATSQGTLFGEGAKKRRSTGNKEQKARTKTTKVDEESQLAAKAHEEATVSNHAEGGGVTGNTETNAVVEEEEKLGPYGRGLIDEIGGIWDATYKAHEMAVQRQLDDLIKEGMTLEQASDQISPDAARIAGDDGVLAIGADLRLVRYPKEKTFRERLAEINMKGDKPSLSLFAPGLAGLGIQVREFVTDMAVQLFISTWSDPSFVQKVQTSLERQQREQKVKLEHHSHIHY